MSSDLRSPSSSTARSVSPRSGLIAGLRQKLRKYMALHGLRSTAQRRCIVETFFEYSEHVSVDDLLARVKRTDPHIGYATVYRTLRMLHASGVASEQHFANGVARYELAHEGCCHGHLVCTHCGAILEFCADEVEGIERALSCEHCFQIESRHYELYGLCSRCQTIAQGTDKISVRGNGLVFESLKRSSLA